MKIIYALLILCLSLSSESIFSQPGDFSLSFSNNTVYSFKVGSNNTNILYQGKVKLLPGTNLLPFLAIPSNESQSTTLQFFVDSKKTMMCSVKVFFNAQKKVGSFQQPLICTPQLTGALTKTTLTIRYQ